MNRILAISKRIWSQFAHDPRTLALLFVAPIVVLWLLSVLLVSDTYEPKIASVDLPEAFEEVLGRQDAHVTQTDMSTAHAMLERGEVDAVLSMEKGSTTLKVFDEGTNMSKNQAVAKVAADAVREFGDESRSELEAYISQKKSEIEDRIDEIKQKREEIQAKIDEARAEAESQREVAQRKISEVKSQIASFKSSMEKLKSALDEFKEKLAPIAATNPDVAAALKGFSGLSIPNLNSGINIGSIDLGSDSINGIMDGIDIDSLSVDSEEFDMNIDIDEFMPVQNVETDYLHGSSEWDMFDFYGPIFIALFLFVFVFITCSFSLVNERAAGTMERFLDTPVRPTQILAGYSVGFGAMSLMQAAIILAFGLLVIGFPNEGSIWLVILVAVSLAIASVTLGLLVSGLATAAFQIVQLMLLFVVPQILLCGLFDLSASPEWLQVVSKCLPLTYGVDAMTQVMLGGVGFASISTNLAVIWGFIVLFFALAALQFRKKRAKR